MNNLTTDLIEALAQKQDMEEVFRLHLKNAINQLLKHELTCFLNYEPYERKGFHSGNSRNGYYDRSFKTEYGELNLQFLEIVMENLNNGPSLLQTVQMIHLNSLLFTCIKKESQRLRLQNSSRKCMVTIILKRRFLICHNLLLKM